MLIFLSREQEAEDDAAIDKRMRDIATGKERQKRRRAGLDLSDSDDEDVDKEERDRLRREKLARKKRKTGGDTLIAFAVLHVFSYSIFWGPTPWVYLGESFPLRVRPKAIALGSATSEFPTCHPFLQYRVCANRKDFADWIWNFLLSFFAPRIAEDIGPLILLIFFGMLTFGFVYVYLFIPETKGLSLEEVDEMYRSGVRPWRSAAWAPTEKHIHDKAAGPRATEVREVREKGDDESA